MSGAPIRDRFDRASAESACQARSEAPETLAAFVTTCLRTASDSFGGRVVGGAQAQRESERTVQPPRVSLVAVEEGDDLASGPAPWRTICSTRAAGMSEGKFTSAMFLP